MPKTMGIFSATIDFVDDKRMSWKRIEKKRRRNRQNLEQIDWKKEYRTRNRFIPKINEFVEEMHWAGSLSHTHTHSQIAYSSWAQSALWMKHVRFGIGNNGKRKCYFYPHLWTKEMTVYSGHPVDRSRIPIDLARTRLALLFIICAGEFKFLYINAADCSFHWLSDFFRLILLLRFFLVFVSFLNVITCDFVGFSSLYASPKNSKHLPFVEFCVHKAFN